MTRNTLRGKGGEGKMVQVNVIIRHVGKLMLTQCFNADVQRYSLKINFSPILHLRTSVGTSM